MKNYYTNEKNALILISLLKEYKIRKVIASPGGTSVALVASLQQDSFFEMYSAVDERSAAYMACGLAAESGEPVVITCTGATASRNYMPGLTEAYYRKLPVLAVTASQILSRVGHLVPQVTDRNSKPKDTVKFSVVLPVVKDEDDFKECEIKVNQALSELTRRGGGPIHINLPTRYSRNFDVRELPKCRVVRRIFKENDFPELPKGRIAILVGSHHEFTPSETRAIQLFCEYNNAVVICDHTSGYYGKYRIPYALVGGQTMHDHAPYTPDLLIHIGEITGDYYGVKIGGKTVWRINEDGEMKDTFQKLTYVFEMPEEVFFQKYASDRQASNLEYFEFLKELDGKFRSNFTELPFSNIWIAEQLVDKLPVNSVIHFGILNSLRSWNFFQLHPSIRSFSNVGGFGIDGGLSSLLGASLASPDKLYFGVIGDLAFFYDMNALGNRHVGKNIRLLLINNGKGTEFKQYGHQASELGAEADAFIAATGHFGKQSRTLVKHYAEDLEFEYISASNKAEFSALAGSFVDPKPKSSSVIFEVFTDSLDESKALEIMLTLEQDTKEKVKKAAKQILGKDGVKLLKKFIK